MKKYLASGVLVLGAAIGTVASASIPLDALNELTISTHFTTICIVDTVGLGISVYGNNDGSCNSISSSSAYELRTPYDYIAFQFNLGVTGNVYPNGRSSKYRDIFDASSVLSAREISMIKTADPYAHFQFGSEDMIPLVNSGTVRSMLGDMTESADWQELNYYDFTPSGGGASARAATMFLRTAPLVFPALQMPITWVAYPLGCEGCESIAQVPEPQGAALVGMGLIALAFTRRRKHLSRDSH